MYHNDLIFDYIILYLLSYEETATNLGCWELGIYNLAVGLPEIYTITYKSNLLEIFKIV